MEPKIKFFFWLLWHNKIPYKKLLNGRKIVDSLVFPRCGEFEDDEHMIRACHVYV